MLVDVRPLWVLAALCSGGFGLLVLVLRRKYTGHLSHALTYWGVSYVCFGVMFGTFAAGTKSEFLLYVLSRSAGSYGLCLEYRAIAELKNQKHSRWWLIGPPVLMLGQGLWFTFAHRNITIEIALFNLLNMVLLFLCARAFWRAEDRRRQAIDVLAGILYLVFGMATLGAVVSSLYLNHFPVEYDFNNPRTIYNAMAVIVAEGVNFAIFLLAVTERLNEDFKRKATHDSLTDLLNRKRFEEIGFALVSGTDRLGWNDDSLSVLMLDIDGFKGINERHGRAIGDFVLKSVAGALQRCLRAEDTLCRWGGDEFCAILPGTTRVEAEKIAKRALAAVGAVEIVVEGEAILLAGSAGVASRDGDVLEFGLLLNWADVALYRAKEAGRGRFAFA